MTPEAAETCKPDEGPLPRLEKLTEVTCADFHPFTGSADRFSESANLMVNIGLML